MYEVEKSNFEFSNIAIAFYTNDIYEKFFFPTLHCSSTGNFF